MFLIEWFNSTANTPMRALIVFIISYNLLYLCVVFDYDEVEFWKINNISLFGIILYLLRIPLITVYFILRSIKWIGTKEMTIKNK
jgi:hypothetical protein